MQGYKGKSKKRWWLFPVLFITVFLVISFSLVFYIESYAKKPNSENSGSVSFTVAKGAGVREIASGLKEKNLIKNEIIFLAYLRSKRLTSKIQAGDYAIPQNLNMIQVSEILTKGKTTSLKITIPEGWTNQQIAEYLEKKGIVTEDDFLKALEKRDYDYEFISQLPKDATLEGFLYPDTYQLSASPTSEEIIGKMLKNFEKKYEKSVKPKMSTKDLSLYELVTFASVVEREVAKPQDRKKVAGVFWNRLNIGMAMESDATIQYILRSNKKTFTYAETRTSSPYNTYTNKGLPKGPIGNVSLDAILAVLEPAENDFLYFLSAEGVTYFSYTLEEHEAKKYKYLK